VFSTRKHCARGELGWRDIQARMALIECPECNTQVSSAAPSCPKCGYPSVQEAQKALSKTADRKRELRKQTNKRDWRLLAAVVILLLVAGAIINRCGRDAVEPGWTRAGKGLSAVPLEPESQSRGRVAPARDVQEAQRCDSYKKGIKAAMPDLFNGDVRREIECDGSRIRTTIRGAARRQPSAERVLSTTVARLVELGMNPRRDETDLFLYIYQTGSTVTGARGLAPLTSASYLHLTDRVDDDTAGWLKTWDRFN
jgi:hypothetical protein